MMRDFFMCENVSDVFHSPLLNRLYARAEMIQTDRLFFNGNITM